MKSETENSAHSVPRAAAAPTAVAASLEAKNGEADRPTNVVFFDGVCGLCHRFVDFVLSRDHRGSIRFAPLQGETANRVVSDEWRVASDGTSTVKTVVWLDAGGREFVRSAAVVRVLWLLGGLWWWIGWLLWLIPLPLRDLGYRIVAASRYRLFGKTESCRLPTPAERMRFLP
jgi:predicted DCC family thiol-disulfide oxidoreductase YuxK